MMLYVRNGTFRQQAESATFTVFIFYKKVTTNLNVKNGLQVLCELKLSIYYTYKQIRRMWVRVSKQFCYDF